ncbi:MAG TPA: serine/threonine-protein kinase [Kofleriaceae bacterium]|nr:serine/threonine-protein kinase [Kofleriaceae bacterium]
MVGDNEATLQERPDQAAGPPATVGRFVIEGELGRGGMGLVLAAHDPVLDRRVAVKLLSTSAQGSSSEGRPERLLREAQALARLTHPNVVTVYDAGLAGDQVFIAMELMEGGTLREWMKTARPWRQVVALFVGAGRGLAAAHAAGLVHRDFKPANVFIDASGRARVGDFGLVGRADAAGPASVRPEVDSPLHADITETGMALGTPAYMAPEQRAASQVDARADQYAFCVSLHEALTGARPRDGDGHRALPARVRPIVERGLAEDPDDRHPSMDALLAELERLLRGRRLLWLGLGAAAVATATAAVSFALASGGGAGPDPHEVAEAGCAADPALLAGVWDDARRDQVGRTFAATGLAYAPTTAGRVRTLLDDYAARWLAARTEACRATHVTHEQSGDMLDLRMQCLDRRRDQLRALTVTLAAPLEPAAVRQAVTAARMLADIEDCSDAAQLRVAAPLPDDPELRTRVTAAERDMAAVIVLDNLGRLAAASEALAKVDQASASLDYPPLHSDIQYYRGWYAYRMKGVAAAEEPLGQAIQLAVKAHDPAREERAWRGLFKALASTDRVAEAEQVGRSHALAIERAGGGPRYLALHRTVVVQMQMNNGQLEEAEKLARTNAAEAPADAPVIRSIAYQLHSRILGMLHRDDESIAAGLKAIEIFAQEYGPDHPSLAQQMAVIAGAYRRTGKAADAERMLVKALGLLEAANGKDSMELAPIVKELAQVAADRGDAAATRAQVDRMVALLAPSEKDDPFNWVNGLNQGALALMTVGLHHEATALLRRSIARAGELGLVNDGAIASYYLGQALNLEGQYREAVDRCTAAAGPVLKRYGTTMESALLLCRGEALLGLRRAGEAVAVLERAVASAKTTGDQADLGGASFALARALWLRGDHRRALAAADQALAAWSGPQPGSDRAKVEAWLRDKR